MGEGKGRASARGQGCPSAGGWRQSGAEAERPFLLHPDTKPPWGLILGSALYQSICSSKGWLKSQPCCFGVSALQLFSASSFIYLFISFQLLEPHSPGQGPTLLILLQGSPALRNPPGQKQVLRGEEGVQAFPFSLVEFVCVHTSSTRHHLHFASVQSACAASKEGSKWCKGIYIPSKRGCWSVRFHLLLRGVGCKGVAVGWRVHPWGHRWKRIIPSFVPSSFLVSWLGGAVVDGDSCVRLCKMPAFTLHKEG